eukprot:CAMPEP_0172507570 /NCGR_PEP_ID=MMETSP1066-20121228/204700_1 /TAXON_ID=671091 /ORGANISM="Coscinodiscus wailesii, Strain CCMP2513" /LENGTH=266 /DNA_ID=CAMNT_0013285153 /DNA_START=113 /DNA_END=913 /DNA_ORIENTATION=+
MTGLHKNWKNFFANLPCNNDANKNWKNFIHGTEASLDEDERLTNLVQNINSVFIGFDEVTGNMRILHSMANLGGRPGSWKSDKIVALDGAGQEACPVVISKYHLLETFETTVPHWTSIESLSTDSTVDVTKLCLPTCNNARILRQSKLMILPPFLADVFFKTSDLTPANLISESLAAIAAFDEENNNKPNHEKASEAGQDFISFLWAASVGKVPSLEVSVTPKDGEVKDWSKTRHSHCIIPVSMPVDTCESKIDSVPVFDSWYWLI